MYIHINSVCIRRVIPGSQQFRVGGIASALARLRPTHIARAGKFRRSTRAYSYRRGAKIARTQGVPSLSC